MCVVTMYLLLICSKTNVESLGQHKEAFFIMTCVVINKKKYV